MKLKFMLFAICFSLVGPIFAANAHLHPKTNEGDTKNPPAAASLNAQFCDIEIVNDSYDNVKVYGTFDDGARLYPFTVYSYDEPQYVDLFYYGYCHSGMYVTIESIQFPFNVIVYSSWTSVGTALHVVPYVTNTLGDQSDKNKKIRVEVSAK